MTFSWRISLAKSKAKGQFSCKSPLSRPPFVPKDRFMRPPKFCLILRPVNCNQSTHTNHPSSFSIFHHTIQVHIIINTDEDRSPTWRFRVVVLYNVDLLLHVLVVVFTCSVYSFYYTWFKTFKRHNLDKSVLSSVRNGLPFSGPGYYSFMPFFHAFAHVMIIACFWKIYTLC